MRRSGQLTRPIGLPLIKPNSKALQELVLYYLRERVEEKNIDIKYLIATNINEWYIIESSYFKKLFYDNKKLVKDYEDWRDGKKDGKDTGVFYNDIAKPFIDSLTDEIPCIYFNIREHEKALRNKEDYSSKELNALFKILSPYHLLKVPFANDSNELDDKFYKELLHIIGLEEAKEGGKNIIRRKKENKNLASLLEKAIDELKTEGLHKVPDLKSFGDTSEEQYFNIALELCLTWINRILFLKLLEGQLINYHKGDQQYRFLNSTTINDFDELFKLFHKVLAVDVPDRTAAIQQKYGRVPYLNSSLFEISELEDVTIKINAIDSNDTLEYIGSTILKENKKKNTKLSTIEYLFQFLDAYDFASEGTGETQEDNKTLINASVLGKVFEKINGYKDGSIYTPGFITMYMSRQSIRLAVVQKFNDANGWACKDFADLDNFIEYQQPEARNKANSLINDLKLCDPAVGSGHFLVSALNEIIAIKSELKILQDINGKRLKEYSIDVVNDELIITDEDNDLFIYNPQSPQSQLIQQTLFNEKQTIIENCLFGVDINPNSVKICRLRLWIELLKNAYYKQDGNLETLPNIDINIKCGNSLLSRFALDADLSKALKSIKYDINAYRGFVNHYKNCKDREVKRDLQLIIDRIKADFRTEISKNDPLLIKLNKASGELYNLLSQVKIFDDDKKTKKVNKVKQEKLEADINKWTIEVNEIKNNAIYKNAFEWRFEFPEVLNNNGEFEGFDILIGNPPYIRVQNLKYLEVDFYKLNYNSFYQKGDIYLLFFELGLKLVKNDYSITFINPTLFISSAYGKGLRRLLLNYKIAEFTDFGDLPIFQEVITYTGIFTVKKSLPEEIKYRKIESIEGIEKHIYVAPFQQISQTGFTEDNWLFQKSSNNSLLNRLLSSPPLKNIALINSGCFTGLDDCFFVDEKIIIDNHLEREIIKPVIMGKEPKKYNLHRPVKQMIYPYIQQNNKTEIIPEDDFKNNFPNTYTYLLENKNQLLTRKDSRRTFKEAGKIWYSYTRKGLIEIFNAKKILVGYIVPDNTYCLDEFGYIFSVGRAFGICSFTSEIDNKFIIAILNSNISKFIMKSICPIKQGGFYKISSEYLSKFPLKVISNIEQKPFIDLVNEVLRLKLMEKQTAHLEERIDALVYQLYDLTPDEIAIVEHTN